jgi:hypothetical protein
MEEWKEIKGFDGRYFVSNTGKVKSVSRYVDIGLGRVQFKPERILKPGKGSHGYFTVVLCKDKKQKSFCVHRIVADAFLNGSGSCINHKDGNKLNNDASNLEWVSYSKNIKHAYDNGLKKPYRKITSDQVSIIRESKGILSNSELGRKYSVARSTISQIVNNKSRING